MNPLYGKLKAKARGCRDREIRKKLELILLALKLGSVTEACARRGYSRKFYHKWFGRLKRSHWDLRALRERSRRPRRSPARITRKLEVRIQLFSSRHYGARMIQAFLKREKTPLSKSTIGHVLRGRKKNAKTKKKGFNPHRRRYELAIPGQRFQMDVKYTLRTEVLPRELEALRLKFLGEAPKRMLNVRQLQLTQTVKKIAA